MQFHEYTHEKLLPLCYTMRLNSMLPYFRNPQLPPTHQLFMLLLLLVAMSIFLHTEVMIKTVHQPRISSDLPNNYLVDTVGCKIPGIDPFNADASRMLRIHKTADLDCGRWPLLVRAQHNTIYINRYSLPFYGQVRCFYREILKNSDNDYVLGEENFINNKVTVQADFVQVECRNSTNSVLYTDFFPFIQPKPKTEERIQAFTDPTKAFRVICLGLDSVSRNQFHRHLEDVEKFMKKHLTFVKLHGYNKVGENTYANMVPFLTGKMASEFPDTSVNPADDLPLVWQEFANAGYRTLFSEDSPAMSIFNYGKEGFVKEPTDYYLRPFSLALENSSVIKNGRLGCLNARNEASVILRWTQDFLKYYPRDNLFTFTFLSRLSHDYFNGVSFLKSPLVAFFRQLLSQGEFQKSIVFFFGDHGFRFGTFVTTATGQMEDKLPFAFVIVPHWFPEKHPAMYRNLQANQHRLTTPLDMHATLRSILHFTGQTINVTGQERSISLISSEVPPSRTCKEAGISERFCSCLDQQPVSQEDHHVGLSALAIVDTINNKTHSQRHQCAQLYLQRILTSSLLRKRGDLEESSEMLNTSTYYITLLANPGLGVFEGTVLFDHKLKNYTTDNNIGRLNTYGNYSFCVKSAILKPFCYCTISV